MVEIENLQGELLMDRVSPRGNFDPPVAQLDRIPLLNRWDIYPVAGTVIGPFRALYGLFVTVVGVLASIFQMSQLGHDLTQNGVYHISRGFQSLVSFIPYVSEQMEESDQSKLREIPVDQILSDLQTHIGEVASSNQSLTHELQQSRTREGDLLAQLEDRGRIIGAGSTGIAHETQEKSGGNQFGESISASNMDLDF